MSYQSPLQIFQSEPVFDFDGECVRAIAKCGVHVDKEELLKALKFDRMQHEKGYKDAIAEHQWAWIPCNVRVPEIGEIVLATWEYGGKRYITTAYRFTARGVTYWNSKQQHEYKPLNVIAWMPLPAPFEGDLERGGVI